jgi:hypothetical protein
MQSYGTFVPGVSSQGNGYQASLHSGIPGGSFLHQFGGMHIYFIVKALKICREGNFYNTNNATNRNTVKFLFFIVNFLFKKLPNMTAMITVIYTD